VMNNALRYTDPTGHCLWDLCILEIAGVSLGLVELGGVALAVGLATPQGREAATQVMANGLEWASEQVSNGINALLHKEDKIPGGMTKEQQKRWGKAAELYKAGHTLPKGFQLPDALARKLKELIQKDLSPEDAADALPELENYMKKGR
jgi:hypothetical protein